MLPLLLDLPISVIHLQWTNCAVLSMVYSLVAWMLDRSCF